VKVVKTANQALADNTFTQAGSAIIWNATELYESETTMFSSANPTRLVAPRNGLYLAVVGTAWDAPDPTNAHVKEVHVIRNGADSNPRPGGGGSIFPAGLGAHFMLSMGQFRLAAGDYVEAWGYQNSGFSLNILGSAANSSFSLTWLGNY
jgi:hypothetical protein